MYACLTASISALNICFMFKRGSPEARRPMTIHVSEFHSEGHDRCLPFWIFSKASNGLSVPEHIVAMLICLSERCWSAFNNPIFSRPFDTRSSNIAPRSESGERLWSTVFSPRVPTAALLRGFLLCLDDACFVSTLLCVSDIEADFVAGFSASFLSIFVVFVEIVKGFVSEANFVAGFSASFVSVFVVFVEIVKGFVRRLPESGSLFNAFCVALDRVIRGSGWLTEVTSLVRGFFEAGGSTSELVLAAGLCFRVVFCEQEGWEFHL